MSLFHHLLALVGLQVAARSPLAPAQPRAMKPDEMRVVNERKTQAFTELSAATRAIKKSSETHNMVNLPGLDGHRESRVFNRNLPAPPPGVIPNGAGKPKLANDSNINQLQTWGTSYGWTGYGFMGYALLSDLAQIPEFRKPSEIIANEMTREWGKFVSKSDDDDKSDRIKELTSEFERLNVQETFRRAYEMDNFFGIGHILIDIGAADDELAKPLGGKLLKAKIAKGKPVEALRCVEPIWMYPNQYNSIDPTADDFYRPQTWFILSIEVNSSRMLSFNSRPVPDMLKPQYLFGGVALTQLLYPYVQNWLGTRQSVSNMISSFSTMVLEVDMDQMMNPGGAEMLLTRGQFYNMGRDNLGLFIVDKNKEGFTNVSAPLGSLDKLQAQAQEQMAGVASVPLVKLFGITPSGLNASSDGEIRAFYDTISSAQERIGTPNIDKLKNIVMITLWGEVDEDIVWHWEPLWSLDEEKRAAVRKTEADTAKTYIDSGVLAPEEARAAVAADENSPYAAIDVENVPDLQGEEEEGLEPEGGRPQPQDVESETRQEDERAEDWQLSFDGFSEEDHPRGQPDNAGQFGSGGGSTDREDFSTFYEDHRENVNKYSETAKTQKKKLSKEEVSAIKRYSKADDFYVGLNQKARNDEPLNDEQKSVRDGLKSAINKSPLSEDVRLFRGVSDVNTVFGSDLNDLKVGSVFSDKGFVSTGTSKYPAIRYMSVGDPKKKMKEQAIIVIDAPKGSKALPIGAYTNSKKAHGDTEYVLPPGSKFEVTAVHKAGPDAGTKLTHAPQIHLKIVSQEDDEHSEGVKDSQGPFSRDSALLGLDAQSLELAPVARGVGECQA